MDDKNNINDELNDNLDEIAPNLSKLKKGKPFGLPGDYFDDLASKIQDKCADADEIRDIAPVLSGLSKYNPFAVPDGYFDELPAQIQEKCVERSKPSWVERLAFLFRPQFAIPVAAAIIGLVVAVVLINGNGDDNGQGQIVSADVLRDTNATDQVTEEALMDMDDATVLESLWSDPVTETDDEQYISANEDEIIDYLLENNTDVSSIVNEL